MTPQSDNLLHVLIHFCHTNVIDGYFVPIIWYGDEPFAGTVSTSLIAPQSRLCDFRPSQWKRWPPACAQVEFLRIFIPADGTSCTLIAIHIYILFFKKENSPSKGRP